MKLADHKGEVTYVPRLCDVTNSRNFKFLLIFLIIGQAQTQINPTDRSVQVRGGEMYSTNVSLTLTKNGMETKASRKS